MAELLSKPALQKPPGYKEPNYAAEPRPATVPRQTFVLPPSFHQKKRRRSCFFPCCCFLCVLIVILIIVVSIAGGLFYLWFNPKLPVFYLESFQISHFNVTVRSDDTYLDAATIIRIDVRNPNAKVAVIYGDTNVIASIGDHTALGSKIVPGFTQGNKNTKSLKTETAVKNELVGGGTGTKLNSEFGKKEVVINVEAHTRLELIVEGWRIGPVPIKALCGGVSLKNLDDAEMPKCTINLFKWINVH